MKNIREYFEEVEINKEYDGYYYAIPDAICIVLLGSLCGLKNIKQIHQWAVNARTKEFLKKELQIERIPCYYWLLCLLKLVKPDSLNQCLMNWAESLLPKERRNITIALDGKTIRSTGKMDSYTNPLHIVSAQLCEMGITLASKSVDGKSNEIPAVQELLKELDIRDCIIVADALNCQKKTAKAVIDGRGDYLLSVKGNQSSLEADIADYVQNPELQSGMERYMKTELNRGRIEKRTAYVTNDVSWLYGRQEWLKLSCIGAIHREIEEKGKKTREWHYYIASKKLTAEELLHHARMEWAVESMHWLLDVHFGEDYCRIESRTVQENLNILRKCAISIIKGFKERTASKSALSHIMFECLLDPWALSGLFIQN